MSLSLRPAVPADAVSIGEISVHAWRAAYRGLMPDDYLDALDSEERASSWVGTLRWPPPRVSVILGREHGRSVGFAAAGPCRTDDDLGELYAINTRPDTWRSGVGTALLHAATSHLRGAGFDEAILWVLPGNTRARRFYEALGWHADGAQRDEEVHGIVVPELRYRTRL